MTQPTLAAEPDAPDTTSGPRAPLRDLWPYLRPHVRALAVVVAISLVGAGLFLAQPAVVARGDQRGQRGSAATRHGHAAARAAAGRRGAGRRPAVPAAAGRRGCGAADPPDADPAAAPVADRRVRPPPHRRPGVAGRLRHHPAAHGGHFGPGRRRGRCARLARLAGGDGPDRPAAARPDPARRRGRRRRGDRARRPDPEAHPAGADPGRPARRRRRAGHPGNPDHPGRRGHRARDRKPSTPRRATRTAPGSGWPR